MTSCCSAKIQTSPTGSLFAALFALLMLLASAQPAFSQSTSKFAFVANQHDNTVSAYTIDSATGSLTAVSGSPFPAGNQPRSLCSDPQGKFLYAANAYSDNVSVYAIDGSTGALAELSNSPFPAGSGAGAVGVDPSGRFAYVANQFDGTVSAYTIDAVTGVLTQVTGSPYLAGTWPVGLAIAPSGKFLYVTNWSSANVTAYAINQVTGGLTPIAGSPFPTGSGAFQVAFTSSGNFAFVAAQSDGVYAYSVNTSSGALSAVSGSPFRAGSGPYYVAVDPFGKFVYVANFFSGNVSAYAIDSSTGVLSPIAGSPFPAELGAGGITVDLSGRFVYTANFGPSPLNFSQGNASGFSIDAATGALTPIPGSPFTTGHTPISVTTTGISGPLTPTTTTVASSPNPSVFGQAVSFTVHVTSGAGAPAGIVGILNGSTTVGSGTLVSGGVSIPVSGLSASADSITATYFGGGGFASSKSTPLTQTVFKAATTTSLTSSLSTAATNQAVTFTATVTGQYGGATTGIVTFMAGSQSLGSSALSRNVATLTTSFAIAGTYSISAHYNGDSNNLASTYSSLSEKVIAATSVTLNSSLNPSVVGQAVTFTATVASSAGIPPNGEIITFYSGSSVLGTAPLSGGIATITTSSLPAGVLTIKASYPGDANFAQSTSAVVRQTVNSTTKAATATTLATSLNPSKYGQAVTFTAKVTTSGPVPPTGSVAFTWKYFTTSYTIGTATVNSSGIASLTKSNLNAGLFPLTAVYRGDASNLASTSPVVNQAVLQTTSSATVTSSLNPSTQGQAVTFTAKISSPTVLPTGPVTFSAGTTVLGSVQLSGGKASFTTSSLAAGSTVVKVNYNGNSNIKGSSAAVTQVVQP